MYPSQPGFLYGQKGPVISTKSIPLKTIATDYFSGVILYDPPPKFA